MLEAAEAAPNFESAEASKGDVACRHGARRCVRGVDEERGRGEDLTLAKERWPRVAARPTNPR